MRQHPLVVGLSERLGDRMEFTESQNETPQDGRLKAVMTDTGFSLRVRRRDDKNGPIALVSIQNGDLLIFPSRTNLNRCLPDHQDEVAAYMSFVVRFGLDVDVDEYSATPRLRLGSDLDAVLQEIDELARCLQALAGRPGS